MNELLTHDYNQDTPARTEVIRVVGERHFTISGVFTSNNKQLWIDDITIPDAESDSVNSRDIIKDFSSQATGFGAEELRLVCPDLNALKSLALVFPVDKFSFYQTMDIAGSTEEIALPQMTFESAIASLAEVEAIQTNEYFPENWFDASVDIRQ